MLARIAPFRPRARALVFGLLLAAAAPAAAQQVCVDRGVRAGELWCFPLASDTTTYVYLPATVRLANDEHGTPQFSFVRYVLNTGGDSTGSSTITEARGGGVLTFLVELDTPAGMVKDADDELQRLFKGGHVTLRGPLVCTDGRYTLVSSILGTDGGAASKAIATGRAPVLEGNRIALSFDLDPARATLLMKSLEMPTSDVSLMFDLSFSGLTDAYKADLAVHWAEVHKSKSFSAGASYYFVSADIDLAFDELRRTNAIELHTAGNDPATEALVTTVYSKLLDLMFRPVAPEQEPAKDQGSILDVIGASLKKEGTRKFGFGGGVAYHLRDTHFEGTSVMSFDHRATVERHHLVAFNLAGFGRTHATDERFFRTVNLGDPAFQQREIQVGVDGSLLPELAGAINSVTVTLRKTHANGATTLQEVVVDRGNTASGVLGKRLVYGWNGDADRLAWLGYDYRTRWSFRGGGVHETDWTHSDAPMIDLFAPYERRTIQLAGDPAALRARGVRAVVVQVEYPFFDERRRPQLVVRPEDAIDQKQLEILVPLGQPAYDVTLTWQLAGGTQLTAQRHDSSGLVFIDELPQTH